MTIVKHFQIVNGESFGELVCDRGFLGEALPGLFGTFPITSRYRLNFLYPDHASYIAHWLSVLQNDHGAIFRAAAHAQRAADHLHGLQPSLKEEAA